MRTATVRLAAAAVAALGVAANANAEGTLQVGVTGSTPREAHRNPTAILREAEAQNLVLRLAEGPLPRAQIEAAIAGSFYTLDDLIAVGLVRQDAGLYHLDFNLLLHDDLESILVVAEELGPSLAEAVLAERAELEALADSYGHPGVPRGEILYLLIGCFSLDWDGLDYTREAGYRAGAQRTLGGYSFTPWAKQLDGSISFRGLFWGSHNSSRTTATLTTFGDHHSTPRFGLPDLMWTGRDAFRRFGELPDAQLAAARALAHYGERLLDDTAELMLALRRADRSVDELARQTGLGADTTGRLVELLAAADYIAEVDGRYRSRVLVLDSGDAELVDAVRSRGRAILARWHERHYEVVRSRLSQLTPIRQGVPFERVYTEVWHFLFGVANRELAARGLFADPYATSRRHQGFIPMVWVHEPGPSH